jgi:predicted DNA binding CopG/RHH family protein
MIKGKSKTTANSSPCDESEVMEAIVNSLPPPEMLLRKEQTVKVTFSLSKSSVAFFKKHARRQRTHYQKMIRRVIDLYAEKHQQV